jgi:hypothetical protein
VPASKALRFDLHAGYAEEAVKLYDVTLQWIDMDMGAPGTVGLSFKLFCTEMLSSPQN